MIKYIDDKNPLAVNFMTASNKHMSGKLLTYEICGEACVLVDSKKVWIPFSNLSKISQKKVMGMAAGGNEKDTATLKDPKLLIVVTLLTLTVFSYYYVKFSL